MESTRFPNKPLAKIDGKEMVLHTLERAALASCFDLIVCATNSEEIYSVVQKHGFEAILTRDHPTGTDRVIEAAQKLNLDLVVNLQGDEPLIDLDLLRTVAKNIQLEPTSWITAATPLLREDYNNTNVVKIQVQNNYAQDFKRQISSNPTKSWLEHRGIYAYSSVAMQEFSHSPQTKDELLRSIEPLRVLGKRPIKVIFSASTSMAVDTPTDLLLVENVLKKSKHKMVLQ